MNIEAIRRALEGSQVGKLTFPEVVRILLEAGVESYRVDLVRGDDTFYMLSGETHVEKMTLPSAKIADNFSQTAIAAAIRAAQADSIRYPEFLNRAMAAGTAAYHAYLTGRKVIYFGRKGELHIEEFPSPK
jgi:uncharacterized protein YbcV (DUF1398 family)